MAAESAGEILCVVGAGAMGSQIAHQAALHGVDARLVGRSAERVAAATDACAGLLRKRVAKGTLEAADCEAALERVRPTTSLEEGLEGATMVIETVAEDRDTKRHILASVSRCTDDDVVIGTNSSTLPSSFFSADVRAPQRLLNIHFMNPALVMPLVEVVRGTHTSDAAVARSLDLARAIGKRPILVQREVFGFVANRILFIAMQEAFALVQSGVVSVAECDAAVRDGLGWPMGPFAIADLVGLDVVEAILSEGERQTEEGRWAPPGILTERVRHGQLGRKTGSGFTV
ncbi:MAG: 3-hydroxyacyl-CoA dehydrogenase family protein [Candidatus Dormibacteria bacterium]